MRRQLETLNGFKYYRFGKSGSPYPLSESICARRAFEIGLDVSPDAINWFPAFTEVNDE